MRFRILAVAVLAICGGPVLNAQNPTASVVGIVSDASGAGVLSAKVEIRDVNTGNVHEVTTDLREDLRLSI